MEPCGEGPRRLARSLDGDTREGVKAGLHPDTAHAQHVEPRSNADVRYDRRNGITLSALTHDRVERHQLRIVGTAWFEVNGKQYVDCDAPVRFEEIP